MKYSYAILATAGLVAAQSPEDFFPPCALQCIADASAQATDCGDDFVCRCTPENQEAITAAATECVISSCGIDIAVGEVIPASEAFCEAVAAGGGGDDDDDDDDYDQTTTPVETPVQTTPAETTTPIMETTTTEEIGTVKPTQTANETAISTGTPPAQVDAAGVVAPMGSLFAIVLGALIAF